MAADLSKVLFLMSVVENGLRFFSLCKKWQNNLQVYKLKPQSHISTDQHGSPGKCRIPPDPAGSRFGIIRADFGVVERRRSSNERHAGGKTAATRTNPAKHGQTRSNTVSTRRLHGWPRTVPNSHGRATDQHGRDTDSPEWTRTNTACTRTIPDVAIFPERNGRTREFWTSQNCRVGLPEPQRPSRTFQDHQG